LSRGNLKKSGQSNLIIRFLDNCFLKHVCAALFFDDFITNNNCYENIIDYPAKALIYKHLRKESD